MARQAGMDPAPHARDAEVARRGRRTAGGPEVRRGRSATDLRAKRHARDQAGNSHIGWHLHPSRLFAGQAARCRLCLGSGWRLEGRVLLSLPRFQVRSRRPRFQECAGAHQPSGSTPCLPERHAHCHRRRSERSRLMQKLLTWIDDRFPLTKVWKEHLAEYYAPKNFNFWYYFGSLALLVLVMQIATGIFLTMHYKPDTGLAFASVEYIMRDVDWGWLIRYMHSTGASFFFIVVYLHMFRGMMYGSYKKPRELLWLIGMVIFLLLMAEAFMGYLLPWGQMSFWGAQVIINLFGAIPFGIGDAL